MIQSKWRRLFIEKIVSRFLVPLHQIHGAVYGTFRILGTRRHVPHSISQLRISAVQGMMGCHRDKHCRAVWQLPIIAHTSSSMLAHFDRDFSFVRNGKMKLPVWIHVLCVLFEYKVVLISCHPVNSWNKSVISNVVWLAVRRCGCGQCCGFAFAISCAVAVVTSGNRHPCQFYQHVWGVAPKMVTLDDIKRWKVPVLKDYLRKRGLKTSNRKKGLCALVYAAHKNFVLIIKQKLNMKLFTVRFLEILEIFFF